LGAPQYHDYARSIHSSGRILLKSAEDALAITNLLTRPAARGRESTAGVRGAIDDMLAFHQAEMQMLNLDLAIDATDALEIMGEAQTLRQILINLMSEAIENAEPGSDAAVRCSANAAEVFMTLSASGARRKSAAGDESFNMVLARTLVQLSQGRLIEYSDENNWSATAVFPRSSQRDFFAAQQDVQVF
jgi:two-component system cell cycle sensor histidine kinase PleC